MSKAFWIWSDGEAKLSKEVCFFQKELALNAVPARCEVKLSADSCYDFYVNGALVRRGPQKSDRFTRYYDLCDIAPLLRPGKNLLSARVCHFIADEEASRTFHTGPISILCSLRGGFLLDSDLPGASTDASWQVLRSDAVRFTRPFSSCYATDMLQVDLGAYPQGFEHRLLDDGRFQRATIVTDLAFERYGSLTAWPLYPANVSGLSEIPIEPERVIRTNLPDAEGLSAGGEFSLAPGASGFVEIDMGRLTTAHLRLAFDFAGNKPTSVRLSYAESYFQCGDGAPYKARRDDSENGVFLGETDQLLLSSPDGAPVSLAFDTIFFRTFRFLRIDFEPCAAPLALRALRFSETRYPLKVEGAFLAPAFEKKLWDVSLRTLELCMHYTYEDCPYYEQMQYTMDTALMMKYTYQVSRDDLLARNAIEAFAASRMPDGLIACNSPSKFVQVIPGFCFYYIEMLRDHYWHYADAALLKKHLCVADSILQHFASRMDPATGLFPRSRYWEFVDWVAQWHHNYGVPIEPTDSVNALYHEMFVYFAKMAADLNDVVGRHGLAAEYRALARRVKAAVLERCFDPESKRFADSPGKKAVSLHAQLWAVLAGIVEDDDAPAFFAAAISDKKLYQCSYSMSYYLFRALEKTGLYARTRDYYQSWAGMLDNHMTTWCEDPVTQRSDCHGWSSLPLYELSAMILGVKPGLPGFERIRVEPFTENHGEAEGAVSTAKGPVHVRWTKEADRLTVQVRSPEGVPLEIAAGGAIRHFPGGEASAEFAL